jgi:hypothetical protein
MLLSEWCFSDIIAEHIMLYRDEGIGQRTPYFGNSGGR